MPYGGANTEAQDEKEYLKYEKSSIFLRGQSEYITSGIETVSFMVVINTFEAEPTVEL
jgi:hypothetical protein